MPGRWEDLPWVRLEDRSAVATARRAATDAAVRVGFSEDRVAEVGLVVTELATNAVVHASAGSLLTRIHRSRATATIEVVVIDSGPGVADLEAMFEDGLSTRGTLGLGLGTVRRLANRVDVFSRPMLGSIVHCEFAVSRDAELDAPRVDGLTRPILGEAVCGDAWAVAELDDRIALVVADGLGHGELAAVAARAVLDAFHENPWAGPSATITAAHQRSSHTRGAAVMSVELDTRIGALRWCGVGNVAGRITTYDGSRTIVSQPGIVGHRMGRLREEQAAVGPDSVIVLHSDGLTNKWELRNEPTVLAQSPTMIAAFLLRGAGLRQDDASVVVVKARP